MKKSLFVLGVAVAALASCTNEEVVGVTDQQTGVISFAGSGINNMTKADTDNNSLTSFNVYGGYDGKGDVFNGTAVTGTVGGGVWNYSPLQYWVDGKDYKFAAYAPADGATATWDYANGLTLEITGAGTEDVVYAAATKDAVDASDPGSVSFAFNHILSKVEFKFTLDETLKGLTVTLQNLTVGNTIEKNGKWEAGNKVTATTSSKGNYMDFSSAQTVDATNGLTTTSFYVIPQDLSSSTITIYAKAVATDGVTEFKNGSITATLPVDVITEWEEGKYYLYTAELGMTNIDDEDDDDPDEEPEPIQFEVTSVAGWGTATSDDIDSFQ